MRHLILMRHAEAGMPPLGEPDKQRPLTIRGQQDSVNQSKFLLKNNLIPDKTICSAAKRTSTTWDMVKSQLTNQLPFDFEEERLDSLYNASHGQLMDKIVNVSENIDILMIISHNPGIHETAQNLSNPTKGHAHSALSMELQIGFPPASMAIFEINSFGWHDVSYQTSKLVHLFKI